MAKSMKKKGASPPSAGGGKRMAKAKKPQRQGTSFDIDPAAEAIAPHFPEPAPLSKNLRVKASPEVLTRLWTIIENRKGADPETSHSARLLARGAARVAQKLGEEAVECLIEVMTGNHAGLISESADVLYHLLVVWVHAGVQPEEVWQELQQRERISDLAEGTDVPLEQLLGSLQAGTSKIP